MESVDAPSASADRMAVARPPGHRMGSPAPWGALPAADRRGISLDCVRSVLVGTLTGETLRPEPDQTTAVDWQRSDRHDAAVLVPLFEEDGETRVVLTVRSDQLRSHRGEVAFPGGRLDEHEGIVEGALREAYEEVGIEPDAVTVIGELTTMPTVSSNTVMTPVVGALGRRPVTTANPGEVARIFDVSLAELAADGVFHEEWWLVPERNTALRIPAGEFPVWFFEVAGVTVWGATARCLTQLLSLTLGVPVPRSLLMPLPAR
jgi:8-oxo-dGTP pyrophosphatase MutT (NUDIX family)